MPRILALDSSTDACSAAMCIDGQVQGVFAMAAQSHTRKLLPMVEEVLAAAGQKLADLDAIAFGRGPGSFTGLRICLGVVQGLAYAARLPVVPVSTLEAMAFGFYRQPQVDASASVLVALDARMDEVYWALYEQVDSRPRALSDEAVTAPAQVAEHPRVKQVRDRLQGVGAGWHYPSLSGLGRPPVLAFYPRAEDIALLAEERFLAGETVSAEAARPTYLRDTISWQKRQRLRSS